MLYSSQLQHFVRLHRHLNKHFLGVYALNQLPRSLNKPARALACGLIVNTDTNNLPGRHWIACLLLPHGRGEVFDSFGQLPPPRVQLWMNRHCPRGWTFNSTAIQSPLSTLCGGYCLYYLFERMVLKTPLKTIICKLTFFSNGDSIIARFLRVHGISLHPFNIALTA